MKRWIALMMAAGSIWLAGARVVKAQTIQEAAPLSAGTNSGVTGSFSDKPFFGTQPVVKFNGDYVNTPLEDYEMYGVWNTPLTLDQPHGLVAELSLGEARKKGEWQLAYKRRVMNMDGSWQTIAQSNPDLSLSERSAEVLKASYNLRDRWQVGVAAVFEQRGDPGAGIDPRPFGLGGGESFGLQIDSSVKF